MDDEFCLPVNIGVRARVGLGWGLPLFFEQTSNFGQTLNFSGRSQQQNKKNACLKRTRKPCYRKDDRVMRPMYTYKLFTLILFTLTVTILCADFDSE